jgi:L-idonate 5-dehydrogenase
MRKNRSESGGVIIESVTNMSSQTKAIIIHSAHDLRIGDVPLLDPGPGEVEVTVTRGGICGSDLHYYHDGGFGTVRLKEPMVLGHEIAGTVTAIGAGVTSVQAGDRVAVNPSLPCGTCRFCLEGQPIHCLQMRFYGSAMRFPHVQGGFREKLVCTAAQAVPTGNTTPPDIAAFAEPLAVCLHAVRRAGPLAGRRVLVTGCGPIGALTILAARHAGAREIVVTDIADPALAIALKIGADAAINTKDAPDALDAYKADKGYFDIGFEASGNGRALADAIACVMPRGRIVQIGMGGEVAVPLNLVASKEIELAGTFRFFEEFTWAVELLAKRAIDVTPLLSATIHYTNPRSAFELASDRTKAMKVQLAFD